VGNGLMWASVVALLSQAAGQQQGAVQGLAGSVGAAASIMGLTLAGILYDQISGWLFVISAGCIFGVVLLSAWCPRDKLESEAGS
jgi:MFS family permease